MLVTAPGRNANTVNGFRYWRRVARRGIDESTSARFQRSAVLPTPSPRTDVSYRFVGQSPNHSESMLTRAYGPVIYGRRFIQKRTGLMRRFSQSRDRRPPVLVDSRRTDCRSAGQEQPGADFGRTEYRMTPGSNVK
jgi:hypothetical protein